MSPTTRNYNSLDAAYQWFNRTLFSGELPQCLITLQRHKGAYGYFSPHRFSGDGSTETIDEIALNPMHFASRPNKSTLSTLVHEMVHLWQEHFGKPPRRCYHDKQWATKMEEVGLIPTSTGFEGGKKTGQSVTHLIAQGGPFELACEAFLAKHGVILYSDMVSESDDPATATAARKKAASKTKYSCPGCGLNAWAKADVSLRCGDCDQELQSDSA